MDPFFVADIETLKQHLRLTGTSYCDDVQVIVERAIRWARLKMFREVGEARMLEVRALPLVADPLTADELARDAADLLEVECVYCNLLNTLPVMFKDASGASQQVWNDLGTLRDTDDTDRIALKRACDKRIAELIEMVLPDDNEYCEEIRIHTPDSSLKGAPQQSVFPTAQPFTGRFKLRRLGNQFGDGDGGHV